MPLDRVRPLMQKDSCTLVQVYRGSKGSKVQIWAGEKDIRVWQFNRHEGGETYHQRKKMEFLNSIWS